jgi:phage RecT family recombinase
MTPDRQRSLEMALPKWLSVDRFLRVVFSSTLRNPKIAECTPESILQSIMLCAQLGLEPVLGRAYLIPYNNSKNIGGQWRKVMECQMQPGYQGLIDLARRSGEIVDVFSSVVYENDEFDLQYGTDMQMPHRPYFMRKEYRSNPGEPIGAYAVWHLKGNIKHFEFMPIHEIYKRREKSQAYQYAVNNPKNKSAQECPWIQWPEEMMKKTVIKYSSKFVPSSIEFMQAVQLDTDVDLGMSQRVDFSFSNGDQTQAISAGPSDEELVRSFDSLSGDFHGVDEFVGIVSGNQGMTADQCKAQIMRENDFDNFAAAHSEWVSKSKKKTTETMKGGAAGDETADPTDRDAWFGMRIGTPAKGTGLKAYFIEHRAAFVKVWPSWSDEQKSELSDKYERFYNEPLPWVVNEIEEPADAQERAPSDQQAKEPDDKSVPFDRFNEAWAYGDKQAKDFANGTLGLPAGKRPDPEQYKTWLTYFDAEKINEAQKTEQGERDSDVADAEAAQKWCDDHPVKADENDYSEDHVCMIQTAAASLNMKGSDMAGQSWSTIHNWVQAMLDQGDFEDQKNEAYMDETPGESGPASSESDGDDLSDVERFNELFTSEAGTPAWWYAQDNVWETKSKKRPTDDKIQQWLIDYDEFVNNMM